MTSRSNFIQFMPDQPVKILFIDDEQFVLDLMEAAAETLGYSWQSATNYEQALLVLREAADKGEPFSAVTIDMQFEMRRGEMPIGKMILQKVKAHHPNTACIIISGTGISPHEILDLRDDYGLDYYISKDRLEPDVLDRGVKRALQRVRPFSDIGKRRELLAATLEQYKDICAIYAQNLARLEEKKALRGIDVSVDIENQIEQCRQQLADARSKVRELAAEIEQFNLIQ